MTASGSSTCPACGADFDVRAASEEKRDAASEENPPEAAPVRAAEPVSFQCPACGADYETQEALGDEARAE